MNRLLFAAFLTVVFCAAAFADGSVPNWLKQAAATQPPAYAKEISGVVLHASKDVTLDAEGKMVTVENRAVKILSREGRRHAHAVGVYLTSASRIREIAAWVIRPDGSIKEYDKKTILDRIADPDDIYNEYRIKIIDAGADVDAGFVFGYTIITEEKPLFYHDDYSFQEELPALQSRYGLNLPAGWKAASVTFNHAEVKPQTSGASYVWELRNLSPISDEPLSPSIRNIAPRLAVNFAPTSGAAAEGRTFNDWTAVSRWETSMNDPSVVIDDAVAVKAKELTAGAKTELEKIRAVGAYVQNLQYISIDIGVGHGNGYRPRPSNVVLARGYGDCKDKANLMRAMLRVLKIEAYPVAIYSGDPAYVREEWVSPAQFNHAILAVKVVDETVAPTVLNHPKLGRLLIFDATDPYTPVGDLPDYLQGSFALIGAGENGGLARMPITPPETDLLERTIEVNLTADGEIKGVINEKASGQSSTVFRREQRALSAAEYRQAIEGWLTRGATGAQLIKVSHNDRQAEAAFDLNVEFSAARYAQLMQNRLLVFKPVIVGRRGGVFLTEAKREQPVVLDSNAMRETATFNLPNGFVVDEMPDAVNLEMPFGRYQTKYEIKDNKLVFTRSLVTKRTIVPIEKYNTVKDFYAKIMTAEQSPIVLLRK